MHSLWFFIIIIGAKSPTVGTKGEMIATFIVETEAFMHTIISPIAKMATSL
jgi:hypothetical protein